jgi:hypothetical protein
MDGIIDHLKKNLVYGIIELNGSCCAIYESMDDATNYILNQSKEKIKLLMDNGDFDMTMIHHPLKIKLMHVDPTKPIYICNMTSGIFRRLTNDFDDWDAFMEGQYSMTELNACTVHLRGG